MRTIKIWLALVLALVAAPALALVGPQAAPGLQGSGGPPAFVPGQVLVGLVPGKAPAHAARAVGAKVVRSVGDGTIVLLETSPGREVEVARGLQGRRGVRFAEPNWLRQLHAAPTDSGFAVKWDLHNDGSLSDGNDRAKADADIDWLEAYNLLGAGFSGAATIAVIDTGVDAAHPDLDGKMTANGYDFLDGDVIPNDTYGHGTHVAGIALAETGNGIGTVGVGFSPNIHLMALRVCDQSGCPTSAVVDAINYATQNGADVINLSLGGSFASAAEEQAINAAWNSGLVVVASSGNDGSGRVSYPAAFANAIAVGSTGWDDRPAPYSNSGKDLDLVASGGAMSRYQDPGGIFSTMPTYPVYLTTSYGYAENYDQLQGTSMAAPQVSGLAGLLFAVGVPDTSGDGRSNDEVRALLETTADDLGRKGWDRDFGWGRINAHSALLAATGSAEPDPPPGEEDPPPPTGGDLSVAIAIEPAQAVYSHRDKLELIATVTDGTDPVDGAAVQFDITAPSKSHSCEATTDGAGRAVCKYNINTRRDGVGTYYLDVTATQGGYNLGSASTSIEVQ